jgi:hypothetical protein
MKSGFGCAEAMTISFGFIFIANVQDQDGQSPPW